MLDRTLGERGPVGQSRSHHQVCLDREELMVLRRITGLAKLLKEEAEVLRPRRMKQSFTCKVQEKWLTQEMTATAKCQRRIIITQVRR